MSAPATFETFQQELARLVDKFDRDYPQFVAANYNEATLRNEFLDDFFRALGWDVGNKAGLIHTEREVDIEAHTVTSSAKHATIIIIESFSGAKLSCVTFLSSLLF